MPLANAITDVFAAPPSAGWQWFGIGATAFGAVLSFLAVAAARGAKQAATEARVAAESTAYRTTLRELLQEVDLLVARLGTLRLEEIGTQSQLLRSRCRRVRSRMEASSSAGTTTSVDFDAIAGLLGRMASTAGQAGRISDVTKRIRLAENLRDVSDLLSKLTDELET